MTTSTYAFTIQEPARLKVAGKEVTLDGVTAANHPDPVVREVAREFLANGTTAGTVTVTAS